MRLNQYLTRPKIPLLHLRLSVLYRFPSHHSLSLPFFALGIPLVATLCFFLFASLNCFWLRLLSLARGLLCSLFLSFCCRFSLCFHFCILCCILYCLEFFSFMQCLELFLGLILFEWQRNCFWVLPLCDCF